MTWIACADALPTRERRVLFVATHKWIALPRVCLGYLSRWEGQWVDDSDCDADGDPEQYAPDDVSHWCELPEIPP